MPNAPIGEVTPSALELKRECILLEKRPSKGGLGVFAKRAIAPWQPLCVYPGHVWLTSDWKKAFTRKKRAYAIDYFRWTPAGSMAGIARDVTLDPSPAGPADARGLGSRVETKFAKYCGPFFNEPNASEVANAVWVMDVPAKKLMLYSYAGGIAKGQEILVCYGKAYNRDSAYTTSCKFDNPATVKSKMQYDNLNVPLNVSNTYAYFRLFNGMKTKFEGEPYTYSLDKVHPEGWASVKDFFRSQKTPVKMPAQAVQRAYNTDNETAPAACNRRSPSPNRRSPSRSPSRRRSPRKPSKSNSRKMARMF